MSSNHHIYDDRWRVDPNVKDKPVGVSSPLDVSGAIMEEVAHAINSSAVGRRDMERLITIEMAEVVFGSNHFERLGVRLDETLRLCLFVFAGEEGLDWRKWTGMPTCISVLLLFMPFLTIM